MNKLSLATNVLRYLGPRVVRLRASVYLNKALGISRKHFQPRSWESIRLGDIFRSDVPDEPTNYVAWKRNTAPQFCFPLGKAPIVPDSLRASQGQRRQPTLAERLQLIAADRCIYFFHTPSPEAIDWNTNPFDHTHSFPERIWCDIPDYLPEQGDCRIMWEPARANWAIDLARARSHGIEIDAGRIFWRWIDSWMAGSLPWRGFQWKCGQEAFVRILAIVCGFWSLADDEATTPARWEQMARLAWATGYRIDHHINYARSQKNNHALSEACGLMLIGHLFPELRDAQRWFDRGRMIFSEELARQVYDDGSYVQHSINYHRVMLQDATMAALLAKWRDQPLDVDTMRHIAAGEEFLFQMLDPTTGRAPLYGNNDGAWVLSPNECDFSDYRPATQAAHYLTTGKRRFTRGLWDEDLLWLFGPESLEASQEPSRKPTSTAFADGGYYTLRTDNSWGMIRCHTYRDRPAHYDSLHFDFWHKGVNVLGDCGTYEYYPPEGRAMEDYFQLIRSHNTVEIDGSAPVERVSRYLFFPWPKATARWFEPEEKGFVYFEGESCDYDRQPWDVLHRRAIVGLNYDVWLIIDDLLGKGRHTATQRWHLADMPATLDESEHRTTLQLATGQWCLSMWCGWEKSWDRLELIRGRNDGVSIQGFAAPYYGERIAIPVAEGEITAELPLRLISVMTPGNAIGWQSLSQSKALSQSKGAESYELRANGRAWRVELGSLERSCPRIVSQVSEIATETAGSTAGESPTSVVSVTGQ